MTPTTPRHFSLSSDSSNLIVDLLDFGAALQRLRFHNIDTILFFPHLADYLCAHPGAEYLGGIVGRVCNRIAGASAPIAGKTYQLSKNEGENHLHGGFHGFNGKWWQVSSETNKSVSFQYTSPDGEEGYPGEVKVETKYLVRTHPDTKEEELIVILTAETDRTTLVNLTNHTYFNLNGLSATPSASPPSGTIHQHFVQLNSHQFLSVDEISRIPTGEIVDISLARAPEPSSSSATSSICDPSVFDFREERRFIDKWDSLPKNVPVVGYDHCFVVDKQSSKFPRLTFPLSSYLSNANNSLPPSVPLYVVGTFRGDRPVSVPSSPSPQYIELTVSSNQDGVQIYTGNHLQPTKSVNSVNSEYVNGLNQYSGFCVETSSFPDCIHHPHFPSQVILEPSTPYVHIISYKFRLRND